MDDRSGRYARIRDTATGALAAFAVVGVIAGATALAANPKANTQGHAAAANCAVAKTPASPAPAKAHDPQPDSSQPFLNAIQRLVNDGTITASEGQAVDREIQSGRIDTETLTGFSAAQLQAVNQALMNTKQALAASAH